MSDNQTLIALNQNVIEMSNKIGQMQGQLGAVIEKQDEASTTLRSYVSKHDKRISALEKSHWKTQGKASVLGMIAGFVASFFSHH